MRPSLTSFRRGHATAMLLAVLAVHAGSLRAQGGNARPVASDTIYRLAVDSAGYKDYAFVYLLDDGIVRFETDGRGTERYHQIVQILKPRGVEPWAERQFSYRPGHTRVTINWMRVVKPSGEVISDKPKISQASDVPAAMSDPVYSDTKILRYSLGGVAVGTLVDIDWTVETTEPFLRGDFESSWRTTMDYPALRSRFAFDVPASMSPRIIEAHVDFKRLEDQSGGRHRYVWEKRLVMPVKGELFAPDTSIPRTAITVASSLSWTDIARWYGGLAKDRYTLSPSALATIDSIARAQHTAGDTLRAIHKWIAKDIRYVSVALGLGGYQPRFPDSTITSGFGDCKDKATLFIAAAHHLGLTAYPVLLNSSGVRERGLPTIGQFDHVIAAVPRRGNAGYTFLDLTTNLYPPGKVPPSYQGEFGLVVLPDGKSEEVTFPEDAAAEMNARFDGDVNTEGKAAGRLVMTMHGAAESMMRAAFMEPLDSARRAGMERSMGQAFPNGKVDSMIAFDGRDPNAEARLAFVTHGGDAFKRVGSVAILTLPGAFRGGNSVSFMLNRLKDAPERKYPIDASHVIGTTATISELRLTLPEGWKAQLPNGVTANSVFGNYRSEYVQEGRVLRISHWTTGAKGVYPKERFAELLAWLKKVADDNVDSIALTPPPVP
jgi:transglutaminase-like putative cysteine protease